ncbi:MAG: DegV family protein [Clostridia bacterium]|nr:DegV family protein [Clostridia bacterium]
MNYRIITDSASSLFNLEGVDLKSVPLKIMADEKEYTDIPELKVDEMVEELLTFKGKTSTSCPNVYDWLSAYEGADLIFAVTITSNLSGSYSAAMQAAKEYTKDHPERRVHVVDSLSAGPEMILLLEKLGDLVRSNAAFEEILSEIEAYKKHTHLLFTLQSLNNLARNGRVSPSVAKIAGVLGIRVVGKASDQGTLEPLHKCRGEKKALTTILEEMQAHGYNGGKVEILHCQNNDSADILSHLIKQSYPGADIGIRPCTALCAYYAEKGGMLVGFEDGIE